MSYLLADKATVVPAAAPLSPSRESDIIGAAFGNSLRNFSTISESYVNELADKRQAEQYRDLTGRTIDELIDPNDQRMARYDRPTAFHVDGLMPGLSSTLTERQRIATRRRIINEKLQESGFDIPSTEVLAQQIVKESDEQLQDVTARAPRNAWVGTSNFIGAGGAMMLDPVNLASMMIGAGAARTLWQTMLIEGAIGAGVEIASYPVVADWQAKLGKTYGLDELTTNIMFSAGAGALFGGAIKTPSVIANAYKNKVGGKAREYLSTIEKQAHVDEIRPDGVSPREHAINIAETANRIDTGAPFKESALTRGIARANREISVSESARQQAAQEATAAVEAKIQRLEAAKLTPEKRKKVERQIQTVDSMLARSNTEMEQAAINRLVERGYGPQLYLKEKVGTNRRKSAQKLIDSEVESMRRANKAHKEKLQKRLDDAAEIRLARRELESLKRGEIPESLRPEYDQMVDDLTKALAAEKQLGPTLQTRVDRAIRDYSSMTSRQAPARSIDEVKQELELLEMPERDAALEADAARLKEDDGDFVVFDDAGNELSVRRLLDDDDSMVESIRESLTSCGVGGK